LLSPLYSAGRFENGKSYSELLWTGLQSTGHMGATGDLTPRGLRPWDDAVPPGIDPNPPGGTNYAVGGARSRYHTFDVAGGLPPVGLPTPGSPGSALFSPFSLRGQLESYQARLGGSAADGNALYVVWGGSNDVQDVLTVAGTPGLGSVPAQARFTQAVEDVAEVIVSLVALGAREVLVPTVPDLGVVPAVRSIGGAAAGRYYSEQFNLALDEALAGLRATPGLHIVGYDAFGATQEMFANPGGFGLTEVNNPCLQNFYVASVLDPNKDVTVCANADEHMFWDIVHPSARTHEIVAQEMREAVPEPATWLLVGVGFLAFGFGSSGKRRAETARVAGVLVAG
jgi:phospholipase/lecithinase/hemolysin